MVTNQPENSNALDTVTYGNLTYSTTFHPNLTIMTHLDLRIVVPVLNLVKTHYFNAPVYPVAGKVVYYTLQLSHNNASTASAYNISIVDPLVNRLSLNMGRVVVTVSSNDDNTVNNTMVIKGNTPGDTTVQVDIPILHRGQRITVQYDATVTNLVQPNTSVINTARAQYATTLFSHNNTGNVRPLLVVANTSFVSAAPDFLFALNDTSNPETVDEEVSVGEQVNFVTSITLTPGTTTLARLLVNFPVSVGKIKALYGKVFFMNAVTINTTTGLKAGSLGDILDTNEDGVPDAAYFDFGNILNLPDAKERSAEDTLIIQVVGVIMQDAANYDKRVLAVVSTFTYSNTIVENHLTSTKTVTIVEPILVMTQRVDSYAYNFVEAGNVVKYHLDISHGGASTSAAYNLIVSNFLSDRFTMVPHSVTCSHDCVVVEGNNDGAVAVV